MSDQIICRRLRIHGRVQGVGYRMSTVHKANSLSLTGWVRNLPDGDVEALACGAPADVDALIIWCRQGPPAARVLSVDVDETSADPGLRRFEVR
ncbi:MAG: acylphosphatase [Caldilineaceae bacterium]|nr:acylphosphatase [Caldilineaceae bacterium]